MQQAPALSSKPKRAKAAELIEMSDVVHCHTLADSQSTRPSTLLRPSVCLSVCLLHVHAEVLFCSLATLDPRVGHTVNLLSPFISVLCYSD